MIQVAHGLGHARQGGGVAAVGPAPRGGDVAAVGLAPEGDGAAPARPLDQQILQALQNLGEMVNRTK